MTEEQTPSPANRSIAANCVLSIPCALDPVRPTAAAARSFLSAHNIGSAEADVCEMALVEACNNAVLYAPAERRDQPIQIEIFCHGDQLEFQIIDHTAGFDLPAKLELPSPEAEHGRGLFLIRSAMDEV